MVHDSMHDVQQPKGYDGGQEERTRYTISRDAYAVYVNIIESAGANEMSVRVGMGNICTLKATTHL